MYTVTSNIEVLNSVNRSFNSYVSKRDRFLVENFGGKIFTKETYMKVMKKKFKEQAANRVWNWWYKRGVIIKMKELL